MANKVLSVIIPAYNIESYINQCLDSLVQATDVLPQVDIVVVNDGSTDQTLQLAKRYSVVYPESIRIINKENGGHGSVLNTGIREARGKYIKILDGDDWVDTNGFTTLVQYLAKPGTDADFVLNPYEIVEEKTGNKTLVGYSQFESGKNTAFRAINEQGVFIAMHAMTVRVGMYRENPIPAIDEGIFYVDMEYDLYPVPYVRKMVFLPEVVYQYRVGTAGQSINMNNMIKRRQMHTKVIDSLYAYYRTGYVNADEDRREYFLTYYEATLEVHTEILLAMEDWKTAKAELKDIINKYTDILHGRYKKRKLRLMVKTGCALFALLSLYYRRIKRVGGDR